ncbi:hypothetical protein IAT38_005710 [Cryptococcus sp. DSM 104549]
MSTSTRRRLMDQLVDGQASLDVHSGISRATWAWRFIEHLRFEDIDITGGELSRRWVPSWLTEDTTMITRQTDALSYALVAIADVVRHWALCPNLDEVVIGPGVIPLEDDNESYIRRFKSINTLRDILSVLKPPAISYTLAERAAGSEGKEAGAARAAEVEAAKLVRVACTHANTRLWDTQEAPWAPPHGYMSPAAPSTATWQCCFASKRPKASCSSASRWSTATPSILR